MEIQMYNNWVIGLGVNSSTGQDFGKAIKPEQLSNALGYPLRDIRLDFETNGVTTQYELVSISSQEDLAQAMEIQASALLRTKFAKASGEVRFAQNTKINSNYIYILVKCSVMSSPFTLQNSQFTDDASRILQQGWKNFNEIYGFEYVRGCILGGNFYGLIEIQTTESDTRRKIDAMLAGKYGPIQVDSSFSSEMQALSKVATTKIYMHKVGGKANKPPNSVDEMLIQAKKFPEEVAKNPKVVTAITSDYRGIPLPNGVNPLNPLSLSFQQNTLNKAGERYLKLDSYLSRLNFVVDHLSGFEEYSSLSEDKLSECRKEFRNIGNHAAQEMKDIEKAAEQYYQDRDQKHFKDLENKEVELKPLPGGEPMNFKEMQDKLTRLTNDVSDLKDNAVRYDKIIWIRSCTSGRYLQQKLMEGKTGQLDCPDRPAYWFENKGAWESLRIER